MRFCHNDSKHSVVLAVDAYQHPVYQCNVFFAPLMSGIVTLFVVLLHAMAVFVIHVHFSSDGLLARFNGRMCHT